MNTNKNQAGFSLIELLIVVAIIGIIAAIAIPNLLASRRAANESAAIGTLRSVGSAQATRQATVGQYANMSVLKDEKLVDDVLGGSNPVKSGYTFASTATSNGTKFTATASTVTPGSTGNRNFFTAEDGVISSGTAATAAMTTHGTAIGNN